MKIDSIKIKLLMAELEMNQAMLADKCGIARQNISATLSRGTCSIVKVGRIAKALGVNAMEIIKENQV